MKFQASSLDFPVALEGGRVTFAAISKVDWGLSSLLLAITTFFPARAEMVFTAAAVLIVVIQAV